MGQSPKVQMGSKFNTSRNDDKLKGQYANYFEVGYNAFEFVLDFGQFYPEAEEFQLCTRIVTSPKYIKSFFKVLQESIRQYERDY